MTRRGMTEGMIFNIVTEGEKERSARVQREVVSKTSGIYFH